MTENTEVQCGFIVEVTPFSDEVVHYRYGSEWLTLNSGEKFIGYFRQIVTDQVSSSKSAYITKTILSSSDENIFEYGEEAIFDYEKISLTIKALRGPASNNRYLDRKFLKYPTWNQVGRA